MVLSDMMSDGFLVEGIAHLPPPGARRIAAPGVVSRLPSNEGRLLGVAVIDGSVVPVWSLDAEPSNWVLVEDRGAPVLLGVGASASASASAPWLAVPAGISVRAARQEPPLAAAPLASVASLPHAPAPKAEGFVLRLGRHSGTVPVAALEHIAPMPPLTAAPSGHPAVLGYAEVGGAPLLVLGFDWCAQASGEPGADVADLLAVLRIGGRRLGIPCTRVEPGRLGVDLLARLDEDEGRGALLLAPAAQDRPAPQIRPTRDLLICLIGSLRVAIPVEDVVAIIPPRTPVPAPGQSLAVRGVAAHRGEVLPVFDAGERLGVHPVLGAGTDAPLVRLALVPPVALAVTDILGLRRVPESAFTPLTGDPRIASLAMLDGVPVPLCTAQTFAEGVA